MANEGLFQKTFSLFESYLIDFKKENNIKGSVYDYYKPVLLTEQIIGLNKSMLTIGGFNIQPPDYIKALFIACLEIAKLQVEKQ